MTSLVGTWRLTKWQTFTDRCMGPSPMGETVEGHSSYDSNGTMTVFLAREGFRGQPGRDQMVAYTANWVLDGRKLWLDVTLATLPDIVGRRLKHEIELDKRTCRVRTAPEITAKGNQIEHLLVWDRS